MNGSHWRLRKLDLIRTGRTWSPKNSLSSLGRARFGIGLALVVFGLVPGVVVNVAVGAVIECCCCACCCFACYCQAPWTQPDAVWPVRKSLHL